MTQKVVTCKTRKWGNSLGVRIPKKVVDAFDIAPDEEIIIEIKKKENPIKELFGFSKDKKLTQKALKESRKLMESKWL